MQIVNRNFIKVIFVFLFLSSPLTINAQSKKAEAPPVDRYQEMMESPNIFDPQPIEYENEYEFPDEAKQIMLNKNMKRQPIIEDITFPLITEGVSSGKFQPFEIVDPTFKIGEVPICIIGVDSLSQEWLELRKDDLYENMVACLVIEAENPSQIQRLQNIAPHVFFNAIDGSWLPFIHVNNYPAIIQGNQVFQ